ncbi:MAG: hypothetical protein WC179_04785 [Candidatus Cloacimonadaceae bacterium]|nr:hypothetical protein [Candidatus Cloacimonadota bacterium]MCB5258119.1 hypothetical protein [Candidatus Cloacimonadota bacterium]MDD5625207.1 hypothetical protein [Candidatus Cloacimonadota bacterium]
MKAIHLSKLRLLLVATLFFAILLSSCIKGHNPTGNNWSNVRPMTYTTTLNVVAGYSFPGTVSIKGTETSLVCGNYNNIESVAFMRFTNLPSVEDFHIPAAYQDSTYLSLVLTRKFPTSNNPVELKVYKLNQSWAADSTNLIQDSNLTLITPQSFTITDTISTSGTQIKIPIPLEALEQWTSEADTLGLTLAIKTGEDSYIEIKSLESGSGPKLRFLYRTNEEEQTEKKYEQYCTKDSYRIDDDIAPILTDQWVLNNIPPSRLFLYFPLDYSLFQDEEGISLNEIQLKRTTINRADLIFYVKENPYYDTSTQYSIRADRVNDSLDISEAIAISDDQLASGITTQSYIKGDSLIVNITPLIQAYTSQDKENYGIVIRSMQELKNYGKIEFWHFNDSNIPPEKKPKLRVTYTPPFL